MLEPGLSLPRSSSWEHPGPVMGTGRPWPEAEGRMGWAPGSQGIRLSAGALVAGKPRHRAAAILWPPAPLSREPLAHTHPVSQ